MTTVSLAYEEFGGEGEGNPIILTHGLFWSKFMFTQVAQILAKETKRKVFSLDLRNHGRSPACSEVSARCMVEDIKRFLDERELQKVAFVSHSFSSTFAYIIALEQPKRVEKLVMGDHCPFAVIDETRLQFVVHQCTSQDRQLKRLGADMTLSEGKNYFLELARAAPNTQKLFFKKLSYDLVLKNGKFGWRHDIIFLMNKYKERVFSPPSYGSSTHDILIVRCADSEQVPDKKFEAVVKFNPNAKLATMDNTTHLLMLEEPQKFSKLAADFLAT